jgi:hypothetical protein
MSFRPSGPASSSRSSPARRLLKELEAWRAESGEEKGIERLGPVGEEDLLSWEAVINGRDVGDGYDGTLDYALSRPRRRIALLMLQHPRRSLAPRHHHPSQLPAASAYRSFRDAHSPRQHRPGDGRDLPGSAQGSLDACVQCSGERARRADFVGIPRNRQPSERGRCGLVEGW